MRCCQCQKELPDGVLFCKYCGARQTPQEAGEAANTPPEPEIKPEREPKPPPELAAAGEAAAQPELPPEETAPAEAGEMPVPAAAPAPPAPELRFRDVPEEMERPARTEPEDLVFDLDQILREIAPADAAEPKSRETAPSAEEKEPLWFDPDEVSQPAAVVENTEPAPEAAPLESSVAPEQGEAAAVPAELEAAAGGEPAEPPAREIPAAEQTVPSDGELPASKPEAELPAAEQKEDAAALEKQTGLHAEQRASLPVEEYRPEQNEEPAAPTGLKPQVSVDGSAVEVSQKPGKKPVLSILWRLAVIAAEVGAIAYLSIRLFL